MFQVMVALENILGKDNVTVQESANTFATPFVKELFSL